MLARQGYPGPFAKGKVITGLDAAADVMNVKVFHAVTKLDGDRTVTDGGRVLGVSAPGETLADARRSAYSAVEKLRFVGLHYRTDISAKAPRAPAGGGATST